MSMTPKQERLNQICREAAHLQAQAQQLIEESDNHYDPRGSALRELSKAGLVECLYDAAFRPFFHAPNPIDSLKEGLKNLEGVDFLQEWLEPRELSQEWDWVDLTLMDVFDRTAVKYGADIGIGYQVSGGYVDGGFVNASLHFRLGDEDDAEIIEIPFLEFDDFIFGGVPGALSATYCIDPELVKYYNEL